METEVDASNPTHSSFAPRRRRLALALALGLLLAAGVVVAIVLGTRSSPPTSSDISSTAFGATTVQRRDLVETDTESGTLSYAGPQIVYDRLSGTITWLPAVGRVIYPGQTLYGINGRPVVLLDGALAAYRTLTAKDGAGGDILQLNRDLVRMGFADGEITIDDTWQGGTTDAVKRWQASLGEKQTGKIALGRIVFLPGPQRVTQLETTCGSTGGGGSSSGSGSASGSGSTNGCGVSEASTTTPASHPEFVEFTTSSTTTTSPTTTTTPTPTPTPTTTTSATTTTTPKNRKPPSGHKHGRSGNRGGKGSGNGSGKGSRSGGGSGNAAGAGKGSGSAGSAGSGSGSGGGKGSGGSGSGGGAAGASVVLQTTSTKLVVTVDLAASSQSEAVVGSHVLVEMPDGSMVGGRITAVSAVAQNSSNSNGNNNSSSGNNGNNGSGPSATTPVTITLDRRVKAAGLDQAAVSVRFAQARANNVLSVPVTALIATSGQSYAVQEASPPYKLVPVTTGLFAAGDVEISGAGVHAGLQVTDSQG